MAIVGEIRVPRASKAEADLFDDTIEAAMTTMGGPPAGLMVHILRPTGDGFLICDVWRTEDDMRAFYDDVVLPKLGDAGLEAEEPKTSPVWGFARP